MTTYEAIKYLIENKSIDCATAKAVILDAYTHRKIDGIEHDWLNVLMIRILA